MRRLDEEFSLSPASDASNGEVLTVGELNARLRRVLEGEFPLVWVQGEVGGLSRPSSGHMYFALKDAAGQVQCAWFRQSQNIALAGRLREGMEVLCLGQVTAYAQRSQYQIKVERVRPSGQGELALAFEESRRRLMRLGWFAQERKRPLPVNPARVALITSRTGAAIHDFLELAQSRGAGSRIRLFPVLVQGAGSAEAVVRAIRAANAQDWAEVIVLIRGGGSAEDLWTFNEESVAEAVFSSRLPVLAGIGHEVDWTLADMIADVRAATPSHAAQLLWTDRAELARAARHAEEALRAALGRMLRDRENALAQEEKALQWHAPAARLERLEQGLDDLSGRLERAVLGRLDGPERELGFVLERLRRLPGLLAERRERDLAELERRLRTAFGPRALMEAERALDMAESRLAPLAGRLEARAREILELLGARLDRAVRHALDGHARRLENAEIALRGLDPTAPLRRGFVIVRDTAGNPLTSASDVRRGDGVVLRWLDGEAAAEIRSVTAGHAGGEE